MTCLVVNGNRATIGGEVTRNRPVAPGGVLPNPASGAACFIVHDAASAGMARSATSASADITHGWRAAFLGALVVALALNVALYLTWRAGPAGRSQPLRSSLSGGGGRPGRRAW